MDRREKERSHGLELTGACLLEAIETLQDEKTGITRERNR